MQGLPGQVYGRSDHCEKEAFQKWKAEQDLIRKNRRAYNEGAWYRPEPYEKRDPLKRSRKK